MMAAPSMAEVLAKHDDPAGWMWSDSDQMVYACQCGDHYAAGPIDVIQQADCTAAAEWHRAHVAQALAAAGFGHVASVEARAEAAEAQVEAVRDVLAEHWDWKAGRVLHAAVLAALDGEATP